MDSERTLTGQTVIVEDGRIAAIGRGLAVPPGAQVIDGRGGYLAPGLADMHSHAHTREDLKVYLAHGVTTVLDMGGASATFMGQVRPAANEGRIPAPHVYAAFRVDGSGRYGQFVVATPEEARAVVGLAKTNGYSFIKVYNNLSAEVFEALVAEGHRQGVPVAGHGVEAVGLVRQLEAGQLLVAHSEEFLYSIFKPPADAPEGTPPDPARIPEAIALLKRTGAFVTADLATYGAIAAQWGRPEVVDSYLRDPAVRHLAPGDRIEWKAAGYKRRKGGLDVQLAFLRRFVKDMAAAGAPLVAGADAPTIPGVFVGESLHDDLDALADAGLSNYQALATATRTPGELIARGVPGSEPFGTVAPGRRADLILISANPLEDLSALRRPLGVMVKGRWYPAEALRRLLDGVAENYAEATAPP